MDKSLEKLDDTRVEDIEHAHIRRETSMFGKNGLDMHEMAVLSAEEMRAERRFVLKLDLIVLPLIAVMYFLATLDRGDISNAAVAGMNDELHITAHQLSQCVAFFYIGYIVCQIPGNLFMRMIGPNIQLGCAMIGWGLGTTLLCEAKNWQSIAGIRVMIGAIEAFIQAGPLYLTLWYRREELATRGAIFFSMMAVAGSMNGLIAYGVEYNLNGVHGWGAWRWIFLIEGIMSVGMGFVVLALLPSTPEKTTWMFSEKEREIAMRRSREAFNVAHTKIEPKQLIAVVKDPKVVFVFVHEYQSGMLLKLLAGNASSAWIFDTTDPAVDNSSSRNLSFGSTFLVGMGTYPAVVLIQSWMNSNIIGFTKRYEICRDVADYPPTNADFPSRAGSLAFIMVFGQSFALLGAEIFDDAPHYYRGKGLSLGAMVVAPVVTLLFMFYLRRANDRKRRDQDSEEAAAKRALSLEEICDAHPDFMFWY
ncbi:hypothetical protein UA08_09178 [Talaromyces atroroseus]|uniref:Major facilitator superfamily (MFS) profile domain-containing protein n=1 Tax=Talaromyces atroroseus TaxID=1441469 RepID=A0A1Q5Q7C1_TALAT|nr:hypothetical protein UA08_09178 [Talaromyces atroroseus]OKL55581.1 hypothetical protein UA08_09178 [Talaromyces atroroseus]